MQRQPSNRSPRMRHNQRLTTADLWRETVAAFEAAGKSKAQLARELDLNDSAIHHALKEPEPGTYRYASVQGRIIEHLTGYRITREPVAVEFRATKTT